MNRGTLLLVAVVAVLAGGVGSALALVFAHRGDDVARRADVQSAKHAVRITPARAGSDLTFGIGQDLAGSQYQIYSAECEAAGSSGIRFRCSVSIQGGWQGGDGGTLPDNGIAARYGLAGAELSGTTKIVATYSPDGEQLSWSPGGGSALVADARAHERMIDAARADAQQEEPTAEIEAEAEDESGVTSASGEQDCGVMDLPDRPPLKVTGAGLDCPTLRADLKVYVTRGDVPDGWDIRMCAVSSFSCQNGDVYFRGDAP